MGEGKWSTRAVAAIASVAAVIAFITPATATERIISIGGDVTEIVYALGHEEELVARDATSMYPQTVFALPEVGYVRALAAEGILSLSPTLVIASGEAGPAIVFDQLAAAGVRIVRTPHDFTPAGVSTKITIVANALGETEVGKTLAAEVAGEFAALQTALARASGKPKVLFLLNAQDGAPMAAGRGTAADAAIALAGAQNVFSSHGGYKPLSLEAAVAAAPDVILMMDHTLAAMGGAEKAAQHPALRLTPAAQNGRILAMDGLFLLGFGPREPEALEALARALHPEIVW